MDKREPAITVPTSGRYLMTVEVTSQTYGDYRIEGIFDKNPFTDPDAKLLQGRDGRVLSPHEIATSSALIFDTAEDEGGIVRADDTFLSVPMGATT